ncbi:pullulanase-type alpha-1,6-glucosidase, partial [Cellulomonas carbonis]
PLAPLAAAPVVEPAEVSVPGSHNSEMGCAGDWDPACDQAQMTLRGDGVWELTTDLPATAEGESYQYKIATERQWEPAPNFGVTGGAFVTGGGDVSYTHTGDEVSFFFNPQNAAFFTTASQPVLTLPGDFQSELGCAGDWAPDCLNTFLTDPDGDGVFTFSTDAIPAGEWQVKVAHGASWAESYGPPDNRGGNYSFTATDGGVLEFRYTLETNNLEIVGGVTQLPGAGDLAAQWVSRDLVAVPASLTGDAEPGDVTFMLHGSATGGIALGDGAVVLPRGVRDLDLVLEEGGLPDDVAARFPHLADYLVLRVLDGDAAPSRATLVSLLQGQLVVTGSVGEELVSYTGVQIPGVLDDLFDAEDRELGVTWAGGSPRFALWAPTATDVDVLVWAGGDAAKAPVAYQATRRSDGSWTLDGYPSWKGGLYQFRVTVYVESTGQVETNVVTDPYSVGLTLNSTHSVLVDLQDPAFRPSGWETAPQPVVEPVDQTIYEVHVRDFSISDETVPADLRGTYLAFAEEASAGREHLRALAAAGLTTVHLLPSFDIATIQEDRSQQVEPPCDLASMAPDSPDQQACIGEIRDQDGFNWGYDPFHFSTPEGSYAVDAHGGARVAEFRTMVGALHSDGLQVVLDEVFNHTNASGQASTSVLDRVVPGYYHRLNAAGDVEQSTCCQNVATEHEMAEKLMVDSVVTWAKDYKVDGFRFDLMGHHSKANMLAVREALDELDPAEDGVDGSAVYLYGEGWNFGEVADDARFEQARQGNLGGTGIGTFSDRLRDAVRGGGPFDEDPRVRQGFGSGAYTDPNGLDARTDAELLADAQHQADLVRLGLAGNLRDYTFLTSSGEVQRGDEIDYNGQPAGYADSPEEIITYVDKHDNETLFDILTLKLPRDTPMDARVRMNTVSLATTTLSQTPAFYHAGSDLLRSKSLDRNSYNSGDWFNLLDFSGQDNGFARGLPQAADNQSKWPTLAPLLADPALKPAPEDIATATAAYQDLLRLRFSTELFRLGDPELIKEKVTFPGSGPDATPGVVVMSVDDRVGEDVDPGLDGLLVVFNASDEAYTAPVEGHEGRAFRLSSVQEQGSDDVVRGTTWDAATGTVSVPARTVAVLTEAESVATLTPVRVEHAPVVTPGTPACVDVDAALDVPAGATGLMLNVTTVRPAGPGHVVVYPGTRGTATVAPSGSTVNFEPGRDVANATFVALPEDGTVCYLTRGSTAGVILDVTGWTTEAAGVRMQAPERVLDTRRSSPQGPIVGPLRAGRAYEVEVAGHGNVPEGATSVLLNVTVTGVDGVGNLRVYPGGEERPDTSTVNYAVGQDKANSTIVRLVDGKVTLWSDTSAANRVDVILDVLGWTTEGSAFTGVSPVRAVDSRPGPQNEGLTGPLEGRKGYSVAIGDEHGVPEGATAVLVNVTAIQPTSVGNLRVFPDVNGDGTTPAPNASTVNYIPGRDIANLAVVDLPSNGRIALLSDSPGTVHVAVDVVGYVTEDGAVTPVE